MIAPITGKLRKKIWLDLSVGIGLGVTSAYGFWYVATQSYRCLACSRPLSRYGWHLRKGQAKNVYGIGPEQFTHSFLSGRPGGVLSEDGEAEPDSGPIEDTRIAMQPFVCEPLFS